MLKNKKILVGVSGGIAIYKALDLISRLRKQGAEVRVVMTEHATKFINPTLFREISCNPVVVTLWDEQPEFYAEHIKLAEWADILVVAPATANVVGKMAHGLADDLLSSVALAIPVTKPILLCPAMNSDMYANVAVQDNLDELLVRENYFVAEPAEGVLACGTVGLGRLPEPQELLEHIDATLGEWYGDLVGRHILVTASGTREAIDPVRYIGNKSSGKMGFAVARAALSRGALVTLIAGPTKEVAPVEANVINVQSTQEMYDACLEAYPKVDVVIKAAAVADYAPAKVAKEKIKKNNEKLDLTLKKTPDILKELGRQKKKQILVGFAAETTKVLEYAKKKIKEKNLDFIVANDVSQPGAGFDVDTNIVKLIDKAGKVEELPQLTKDEVAHKILDKVLKIEKQNVSRKK
ncbi:MAG: bifunctional phosphopantothenoylcysteine decarboxylase/phosphopantothenate--cysteine ligase CoaBC [Acidaminococcaceae bacterium]|nr:bifunctional phosphopantothenoylcysteine decarboxylase/phosphopantothenate--cysteine ligase CoaBC [Acidaminococcaceae bacterium]